MRGRSSMMRGTVAITFTILALASVLILTSAAVADPTGAVWNEDGELLRPENYRQWVCAGTPVTPHDMNGGNAAFPEFHVVYIDPASYKAYQQTGVFPEGTTLVKELVSVGAKKAVSGNGYFMGEFLALVVAVKSAKRFPDEPGNWAYFNFGEHPDLAATAPAMDTASCNACHQASAQEDWVFTQYYPVLRDAKPVKHAPTK